MLNFLLLFQFQSYQEDKNKLILLQKTHFISIIFFIEALLIQLSTNGVMELLLISQQEDLYKTHPSIFNSN